MKESLQEAQQRVRQGEEVAQKLMKAEADAVAADRLAAAAQQKQQAAEQQAEATAGEPLPPPAKSHLTCHSVSRPVTLKSFSLGFKTLNPLERQLAVCQKRWTKRGKDGLRTHAHSLRIWTAWRPVLSPPGHPPSGRCCSAEKLPPPRCFSAATRFHSSYCCGYRTRPFRYPSASCLP